MASISISGWSNAYASAGDRAFTLTVTESSYDAKTNKSVVEWTVSVTGGGGQNMDTYIYASVNGTEVINKTMPATPDGGWTWSGFPTIAGSSSGTMTIEHGSDGKKSINLYLEGYAVVYSKKTASGTLVLTNLDRTAPTVTTTQGSVTVNSVAISATSNVNCNSWDYRLGNGAWTNFSTTNGTSASKTITGLSTNTTYTISVRAKKTSNDVYGTSNTITATTLGFATISSANDITLGSACNVKWTPLDSTHKYKLTFTVGTATYTTGYISPASTSQYTYTSYTPPIATFAPAITNSSTGSMTITLETFTSGNASIGTNSTSVTVTIPNNASTKPTVSISSVEQGNQTSGFTSSTGGALCVKSLSNLVVTYSASGLQSAKITSATITVDGQSYSATHNATSVSGATLQTGVIGTSGTLTVSISVTDSRGFTSSSATSSIFVADYYKPSGSVAASISGQSVKTDVTWRIAPVKDANGKPVNTGTVTIIRKKVSTGAQASNTIKSISASTSSTTTAESEYTGSGTWTAAQQALTDANIETYEYTLFVTDRKGASYAASYVASTGIIAISRLGGGNGVTFFGEAQNPGLWMVRDGTYQQIDPHESYLLWGGKNFANNFGPLDAAMIDPLGANRFAFAVGSGITIEYSTNGGSSWTDYGLSDVQKSGLFSAGYSVYLGNHSTNGSATENDQLRVTINTGVARIYTELKKIAIYMSTSSAGTNLAYVKIEKALESTPTSYSTHLDWTQIYGWSGYNILNIAPFTTYGNTPGTQYGRIRFTFKQSNMSSSYSSVNISRIMGFGGMGWTTPSNMAREGHLYTYDNAQNAIFPAAVTGTSMTQAVANAGTDTTGRLISAKVLHDTIVGVPGDYVIEQGVKTATHTGTGAHTIDWTYRKWNNGTVEIWGERTIASLPVTYDWGNGWYYSGGSDANYVWALYPSNTFKAATTPICFVTLYSSSASLLLMNLGVNSSGAGSTPRWHAVRSGSATVSNVVVGFHAIGVWQ